jgi:hypothetical protein
MRRACSAYEEMRRLYRVLLRKSEGKRPLGRTRSRREAIKTDLQDVRWGGGGMGLISGKGQVNAVMNIGVP